MLTERERIKYDALIDELLENDQTISPIKQQQKLGCIMGMISERAKTLESSFQTEHLNLAKMVTDLEHLVVFHRISEEEGRPLESMINIEQLPESLRNLSGDECKDRLELTLVERRAMKDWSSVYRVVKEKTGTISNFISGMSNRKYDMRRFSMDSDDLPDEQEQAKPKPSIPQQQQFSNLGYNPVKLK